MMKTLNINYKWIFFTATSLILAGLLIAVTVQASAILMDDAGRQKQGKVIRGGKVVDVKGMAGWKANLTQEEELAQRTSEVLEYGDLSWDLPVGTLDLLVERREPDGLPVKYETLFALRDSSLQGAYQFPVVVYLEWNSTMNKNPILHIDYHRSFRERTGDVWGINIPFPLEVTVGDQVHIRLTWGEDGPSTNSVFFNGVEAKEYLDSDESTPSPRSGSLAAGLPPIVGLQAGNSLQSPLVGTILYGLNLYNEALSPDIPFGFGKPAITGVSHDAFAVAGYSGKLVAGDTYKVTLRAEQGGAATFDLVQPASTSRGVTTPERVRIARHSMTEDPDNPGTYVGTHVVTYGEDVEDGQIIGHFANANGVKAEPIIADRTITVDTRVYMEVNPSNDIIPADENSRAGITIVASDANGKAVKSHPLKLTMSTTDEYTGIIGGGTFEDLVGGQIEVDWRGVTDSFGEVTAQYISGFAAKTIVVSAKDMETGDVGVGYVRSYIDGTVDVLVKRPAARALAVAGSMEISLSRDWLTADGRSRSRITAVVKDVDGNPLEGDQVAFTLIGDNGQIREIQPRTDSRGRATADYIAGTMIGQVQIEVRDMTSGLVALVSIELRPDAPAEISLTAEPAEIYVGDTKGSLITAKVTDANGNPNSNTDVMYEVVAGGGKMSAPSAVTDEKEGIAEVSFLPGDEPGVSTIKATVMSRPATTEEIAAAEGAIFLYGLDEDPGRLDVLEWLVEPKDEVIEGQDLVILEDRRGDTYTVKAPREGIVSVFTAEERDRVEYGQTLGYVLPLPE
jgi:biotin carboxyl carrier protein